MAKSTAPVEKPHYLRDLGPVEIEALSQLVARTSERTWTLEDDRKENKFDVFHHTKHIVFRFIEGNRDRDVFYSNPNWEVWKRFLTPVMEQATKAYGFRNPVYPKAMFARLAAGAVIDMHSDGEGSHEYTHKIHVPIQTNPETRLVIRDRKFHLERGRAYELDNLAPHAVENPGPLDRIHFIFEVYEGEVPEALASGPTARETAH